MTPRPDFRSWKERLAAAADQLSRRIRYTRKSTEAVERQVASHAQQSEAADREWGEIDSTWLWQDSCTGTTFDRPGFNDMLDFCRAHPQSKNAPGRVEVYDPSRFGRSLDADGKPDVLGFQAKLTEFEQYRWRVEFVTVKRTGEQLADLIMMAMHAYSAAQFSTTLSANVRRGRVNHAQAGWWTSGSAPWGTLRKDTRTDRVLMPGEVSTPGGGGTILIPDQPLLDLWKEAAERILAGASLDAVGTMLYAKGIRGPRGGAFGHRSVRNILTNPVLIGYTEFLGAPEGGARPRTRARARWEPMVDVDLFERVSARLGGHSLAVHSPKRRRRELFPLAPVCAHCGCKYIGSRLSEAQGNRRQYAHVKPKARMDEAGRARFDAAGCKNWYIDADELETKIRDAIVQQRTSAEFENEVRALILDRDNFRKSADEAVAQAERDVKLSASAYERLSQLVAKVLGRDAEGRSDDALVDQLKASNQALDSAKHALEEAKAFARSREEVWPRLSTIIHETRNLAATWEKATPEERKILLSYWVLDVMIVVEPVPGMKRANHKTALVVLRTIPNAPIAVDLTSGQRAAAAIAARTASATAGSSSKGKRSRKAAKAAADPTLPSSEAACRRTKGAGSASPATSAETSSSVPNPASTTDALRLSPVNLTRFMGDFENAAENSDCNMPSSSTARVRASRSKSAARGAKAGSESSRENLQLYGHTSWEKSHQNLATMRLGGSPQVTPDQ